jgi:DNA adenine methylase
MALPAMAVHALPLKIEPGDQQHGRCIVMPSLIKNVSPILRWAGGKRQLINKLVQYLPKDVGKRKYHEPFLGAGSLFFRLTSSIAHLADANEHLIETYRWVAKDWKLIARYLGEHKAATCESYYYQVRRRYNRSSFSAAQAARFIYLNKTCFNGIFRVNRAGDFNVPYGWKEPPAIPNAKLLHGISNCLRTAQLTAESFELSLDKVGLGDFVYLDPPYPALNGTSYFTHYTRDRFSDADQEQLATEVGAIHSRGALFLMTNADTPVIRNLYRNFQQVPIPVVRFITCKAKRHVVSELLIRNFN